MRLLLSAARSLPTHRVAGEITIHCIEGLPNVPADGRSQVLRAGHRLLTTWAEAPREQGGCPGLLIGGARQEFPA